MISGKDRLEKLGLSECADRFAENRIDFSVLRDLTDQDLEEIGVVLGDRPAIFEFSNEPVGIVECGCVIRQ